MFVVLLFINVIVVVVLNEMENEMKFIIQWEIVLNYQWHIRRKKSTLSQGFIRIVSPIEGYVVLLFASAFHYHECSS